MSATAWVESEDVAGAGNQNAFTITPTGSDEMEKWLRTPPGVVPPPRDELVIKVLVAMRVPDVDLPELLQTHRRHLVEVMQECLVRRGLVHRFGGGTCGRHA